MKKVLIITYYWPPSGGISVLRALKIAKYLREFGWEPVIFTAENAHYPYYDESGFVDIPEGITVIKHPIIEPFKVFKWLTGRKKEDALNSIVQVRDKKQNFLDKLGIWVRGNFFIPDARSLWIKPSVKYLKKHLKENPVDAIFSDGPPHTNNRIAYFLSKELGIPWLADFQDPWTQADYYQMMYITKTAHKIHSKMEQGVFQQAKKITIASPTWKKDLESIGAKNVDVIYYGYDEDDFKDLVKNQEGEYFDIVHIGLLGIDRNPVGLVEILSKIKSDRKIRVILAGQVDQQVKKELGGNKNVEVVYKGIISRKESLQLAMEAHLLLLPLNKANNAEGRLPGKLYEYLRTYNPILCLGKSNGDAAKIINKCKIGSSFEYEDIKGIRNFIEDLIQKPNSINVDKKEIETYSNKKQTQKISNYLNEIHEQ
ncbi:Glycosyltransferase involved in cell wall bisynthesis [Marivirga sericea]|uniref:Glycosyltransferase involved in cell wall bisynthesis n=1 Tax=Marivirga sericea TaxID=1028 RepID=A0A1X7LGJ5_9BACT|nr:glycosyltransferase [Marivirga sericea]SMG52981.1 Glycosyltransferase involved in cell wall bisynthesis [Marivirga sericea]